MSRSNSSIVLLVLLFALLSVTACPNACSRFLEEVVAASHQHSPPNEFYPLTEAIRANDLEKVEELVSGGVDEPDQLGGYPLLLAIALHHNDIFHLLMEIDADIDVRCGMNLSALHIAAMQNNVHAIEKLLEAGMPVDILGFDSPNDGPTSSTPLHMACQMEDDEAYDAVEALIAAGADVNALTSVRNGLYRRSPLYWARREGNSQIADLLLKHGATEYPDGAARN